MSGAVAVVMDDTAEYLGLMEATNGSLRHHMVWCERHIRSATTERRLRGVLKECPFGKPYSVAALAKRHKN